MTAVIWIDWYSYHISRLRALCEHQPLQGKVTGIELVGGCGVHSGLKFRDNDRAGLPISSLFPRGDWQTTGQMRLGLAVWRKLQQVKPSAVLVPGYYSMPALAAALWARLHGRRSVLMSETTEADHRRVWWKEAAKRLLVRTFFDSGICGGRPHIRYLRQLGFATERIARFYDVVDNNFYQQAADQTRQGPQINKLLQLPERYFLYVGRLAPEKNIGGLLEAFARYQKLGGDWSLVLVGDGPERTRLERLANDLDVAESVMFAGLKKTRETIPYYAFAGCFVLPSVREPWGLVVNEAMASGLPVIVSERCGCAEDLVASGRNGFVFSPERPVDLVALLQAVGALSPAELRAMGQTSREIIAGYSPRHWAAEVARLLQ